jgi:hypothetical protein
LDVPRAVDTVFTKNTRRARMKVAVLDPSLIPDFVDVVIGTMFTSYSLQLERRTSMVSPKLLIWTLPRRMIQRKRTPWGEIPKRITQLEEIPRKKWMLMGK